MHVMTFSSFPILFHYEVIFELVKNYFLVELEKCFFFLNLEFALSETCGKFNLYCVLFINYMI